MRYNMEIINVTSAKKKSDNSIELSIADPFEGSAIVKRYSAIRGGISWPTAQASAYFCIVGQEYVGSNGTEDSASAGTSILLAEHESKSFSLSGFYDRIIDLSEQMLCSDFYVYMDEVRFNDGFLNDFQALERSRNVCLQDALDKDNFLLGISRIRESIDKGLLIIPEDSILYGQVQGISREDLQDKPEDIFFAINALRHVVGSFYRFPARNFKIESITRQELYWWAR